MELTLMTYLDEKDLAIMQEYVSYTDPNMRCNALYMLSVELLRIPKFILTFRDWILKYGKDEKMKELLWMRSVDKSAFAVYKYNVLGIGNPNNRGGNVDRIATMLYIDQVVDYLMNDSGDANYNAIGREIAGLCAVKTQFGMFG